MALLPGILLGGFAALWLVERWKPQWDHDIVNVLFVGPVLALVWAFVLAPRKPCPNVAEDGFVLLECDRDVELDRNGG